MNREILINEVINGECLSGDTIDILMDVLVAKSEGQFAKITVYALGGVEDLEPIPQGMRHIQIMSTDVYSTVNVISHWICTYYDGFVIRVYDSLNRNILSARQENFLHALFPHNPEVLYEKVQNQQNDTDCGVFAVAFATSIALDRDPQNEEYDVLMMRNHLANILQQRPPFAFWDSFPITTSIAGRPKKTKRGRPKVSILNEEDQVKAAKKKYFEKNREQILDAAKKYSQTHPEVIRGATKRYSQKYPEIHRDAAKKYSQMHPEVNRDAVKRYADANRDLRSISQKIRRTVPVELRDIEANRKSSCIADKSGKELDIVQPLNLKCPSLAKAKKCSYCNAPLFVEEASRKKWCCGEGVLNFPLPPLNANFYTDPKFLKHIRAYNNTFAFSALGTSHGFKTPARGPAFLKVQGRVYHRVFDLSYKDSINNTFLYIDDGEERLRTAIEILDRDIILSIQKYLEEVNPLINDLRILGRHPSDDAYIVFQNTNRRQHGPILGDMPVSREISGLLRIGSRSNPREVAVWKKGEKKPHNVHYLSPAYEPLQYPLIFPTASSGWWTDLKDKNGKKVSQVKYYRHIWLRESRFPEFRRLSQEYIIDMQCRAEEERLQFIQHNQNSVMRIATRREIDDTITGGRQNPAGKIFLPSTHTHSPRYMLQKYLDSMAVVTRLGRPSFFLTVTCNPNWREIRESLLPEQKATDRPDLCVRVFQLKLANLINLIKSGKLFGGIIAIQYVIEFQKRGLPHAHITFRVIGGGPINSCDIDAFVRATVPTEDEAEGRLRELVLQHMVHGPCGIDNLECPCMDKQTNKCTKKFPKSYTEVTFIDDKGFVYYKRPRTNQTIINGRAVNNQWIVPYSPAVLLLMECHCNLEIATSSKVIKYLYKYLSKGPDHAKVTITENINADNEIENYVNYRYISSSEALWRIFEYDLCVSNPAVISLPVHLPNEESIIFRQGDEINALAQFSSKLIIYFGRPKNVQFETLTYLDFYEQYNVETKRRHNSLVPIFAHSDGKHYITKRQRQNCVARLYFILPNAGELYFLRMLLNKIPGYGFEDPRTVDGVLYPTFQEAAKVHGLIDEEREYRDALQEASAFKTGSQLRKLYFIIITNGGPAKILWEEFKELLCEDFLLNFNLSVDEAYNSGLCDIGRMLRAQGRSLLDVGLPDAIDDSTELGRERIRWPVQNCEEFLLKWEPLLSKEQLKIYKKIIHLVENPSKNGSAVFIDGPAGTGKTLLLNIITEKIRSMKRIVLPTATTGIAALNHHGGTTAHSMFKLPLDISEDTICWGISASSQRAEIIRTADLIILDEAPMAHKNLVKCLDIGLQDIMKNKLLFGGKIVLLAGDFRQIPPIIPGASSDEIIAVSLRNSEMWKKFEILKLVNSQRARDDISYAKFIRELGEGKLPHIRLNGVSVIKLTKIAFETSLDNIIKFVFPKNILKNPLECSKRAILAGTNVCIGEINKKVLEMLPARECRLYSADSSVLNNNMDPAQHLDSVILNTITQAGVPDHDLALKVGAVVILIRNLNFSDGLVNGTKLIVIKISKTLIEVRKPHSDVTYLIPRICFKFSVGWHGIQMTRRQFPLKLAYSLTINKAQGQTLSRVGVDLRNDVFSHGQLYVALGRARSRSEVMVLVPPERVIENEAHTANIVYTNLIN